MTESEQSASRWIEGRFLDGQLDLILAPNVEPGPGYAVALHDYRIWRNGEYVGDATRLAYDRDALGWWVSYVTWHGSPLDSQSDNPGRADSMTESDTSDSFGFGHQEGGKSDIAPVLYACCAVDDLPEPYVESERGKTCGTCGREVWWDPKAWAAAEEAARDYPGGGPEPMCQRCMDRWSRAIMLGGMPAR